MALQDAINQMIQIKLVNFPEDLVGHVTGIYSPNDWLLARLVDVDNLGIWLENPNYNRVIVRDDNGERIPHHLQREERLTVHILIRWEYINSIIRFPNEEASGTDENVRTIGFR
jgi:hypothetical protein